MQVIFYTLLTNKTSALVYGSMTNCYVEGRDGMCTTLYPLETSESAVCVQDILGQALPLKVRSEII